MKQRVFNSGISFTLILMTVLSMFMVSSVSIFAAEKDYTLSEVTTHIFSMEKTDKVSCLFYDELKTVPSVNIGEYTNLLFNGGTTLEEKENNVYELTVKGGKSISFDADNDTVHFDDYSGFTTSNVQPEHPEEEKPASWYVKDISLEREGEPVPVDMNLGKYGIDIVEENGGVYIPLNSINDIFSATYLSSVYLKDELYLVEAMNDPYYNTDSIYNTTTRTQAEADYTYNELCFVFDTLYGRPSKSAFSERLSGNSFDEVLESDADGKEIKSLLKSESLVDFFFGLIRLDLQFDDGGHTALSVDFMSAVMGNHDSELYKAFTEEKEKPGNEKNVEAFNEFIATSSDSKYEFSIWDARDFSKDETVKKWGDVDSPITFVVHKDTAVFSFDSFLDDVVEPFKWSLDYAKAHKIKNFVIDLSQNGGGSSNVLMYIVSVTMGVDCFSCVNTISGERFNVRHTIDKNLDGVVDEKDDNVKYDFNYAVLTSRGSFSCGNLLPCIAHENNVPIIGETSGGGACMLTKAYYPGGRFYAFSGSTKLCFKDGADVDGGAPVDFDVIDNDGMFLDYSKLYDLDLLSININKFYGTKIDIKDCKITVKNAFYNGKAQKPKVTVKYGSHTLKEGTDYSLAYSNNKKVGAAKVTVKGKGTFSGKTSGSFKINPKAAAIKKLTPGKKSFTAKWSKRAAQTTGYKLQYSVKSNFKNAKTVTIKSNKTTSKIINKLKAKKKYYVRIKTYKKVGAKTYSSAWSKAKTVKTK